MGLIQQEKRESVLRTYLLMYLPFLCFLAFQVGSACGQENKNPEITLKTSNVNPDKLFKELQSVSGYQFRYTDEILNDQRPFTYNFTGEKFTKVLERICTDIGLDYTIRGTIVTLKKTEKRRAEGKVTDVDGEPLPGATVMVKGMKGVGTMTSNDGIYSLVVQPGSVLQFSFIGMGTQEVPFTGQPRIDVTMQETTVGLDEVVVVGYGIQKKSDITGTVASLPQERLEMVPNINLTQAIQGAISGVLVTTSAAGAVPSQSIMIRGRNSIKASNSPLVIVDGVIGNLGDVTPNDVKSIEVLKDASAAAIYGSRASNGVILVTTKSGDGQKQKLRYNGFYSMQRFARLPDLMDGEEFYNFKKERNPVAFTESELAIYESGEWTDWLDLALRNGVTTEHNLSLSGGWKGTNYYISGNITDIQGLAINDDYLKLTSRINVETKIREWLTIGTRTQLIYTDQGGIAPTWDDDQGVFWMNPLTTPFDENGKQMIYPWPEDTYFRNPLMGLLAKDVDKAYSVISTNYAVVDFPFVKGLQYRINTGIRLGFTDKATYYGDDTQLGLTHRGDATTSRSQSNRLVIENILNYNREFGKHTVFATGVYSFENYTTSTNTMSAQGFPNDFLTWYGANQASLVKPSYSYSETALLSSMLRVNYSYDSRYMLTLTGRRDGYSGFGAKTKWGLFPSASVAWNIANESFFPWQDVLNTLKLRASYGRNGNQAVSAYETITRLSTLDHVSGSTTLPGYIPSKLGEDGLGWESTQTLNIGLDFGILNNRVTGDINAYRSFTRELLLDRTISPIHSITAIVQNIGKVENRGFELSVASRNIVTKDFKWETGGNVSFTKNKIVSLYGDLDENGKEIDDLANAWFIGQPIRVFYGFKWDGVWQLDEAEEAEAYGTQPGYIKIKDVSGPDGVPDGVLHPDYDRIILGQRDPKWIWGMSNTWSYKNLTLNVFIHGVHGVTKNNTWLTDNVDETVRLTTTKKNWWRPDNPTNDWYMNTFDARYQRGYTAQPYEKADFIRIKDISLSYDFAGSLLPKTWGFDKLQLYVTGRNLFTITKYGGMDPELEGQRAVPMQKEYVIGLNLGF